MFLHWLFTVFPHEMRDGWALIRPDLAIWTLVAVVTVVSPFLVGTAGGGGASPIAFALSQIAGVLVVVVQSVRFDQHSSGIETAWSAALRRAALRVIPASFYATLAVLIAAGATALVRQSLAGLLRDTPMAPIAIAGVSTVILISLLSAFAFVPFFATLTRRGDIAPGKLAATSWLRPFATALWPLAASRRASDGYRWKIAPYVVLMIAAPFPAIFAPGVAQIPLVVALMLVSWTAVAVIFRRFTECRRIFAA